MRLVLDLLIPPLYFGRRRRWAAFAVTGLFYLLFLVSAALALPDEGVTALLWLVPGWIIGIVTIAVTAAFEAARARRSPPAPLASRQRRGLEAALIIAVMLVSVVVPALVATIEPPDQDPKRVEAARWEVGWIVDRALEFRRANGRGPAGLEALRQSPHGEGVAPADPWGRAWIESLGSDDIWVCSRGPGGSGTCPPAPRGSIGHSSVTGAWSLVSPDAPAPSRFRATLILVAVFAPWVAYAVYRIGRRLRGRPSLDLGGLKILPIATAVLLVIAVLIPLYANVASRARVAKAQADLRDLSQAVGRHKTATGRLPASLAELTRTAIGARGETVGPFVRVLPTTPSGSKTPQYVYRVRSDGAFRRAGDEGIERVHGR